MPTELLYALLVAVFMLTGVGIAFAVLYALSAWCITEATIGKVSESRPFKVGWACGNVRVALAVN
jgi:cytochrome oxidase Cu insertion factor (SCO1/SenC/PrrC family)